MGIPVALHGFGGGGSATLNFEVVGGLTQPAGLSANTIWVKTDVGIPIWIFSATEPTEPEYGMVWIATGTSSTVAFNALKKNGIEVYPLSAKQYVDDGKWASVDAELYRDGWIQFSRAFDGVLFENGDQRVDVTGGWLVDGEAMSNTQTTIDTSGWTSSYGSWTKTAEAIYIDTAMFKTLNVNVTYRDGGNACFGITDNSNGAFSVEGQSLACRGLMGATGIGSVDISQFKSGYYYVTLTGIVTTGSCSQRIDKVWLE